MEKPKYFGTYDIASDIDWIGMNFFFFFFFQFTWKGDRQYICLLKSLWKKKMFIFLLLATT